MNIALFGYGKMGKMIEKLALERNHKIVAKIDDSSDKVDFSTIDVAIDFSTPQSAFDNVTNCFKNGVPVVSGTTGWLHRYNEALKVREEHEGAIIYASNFSLGVNLFFALNQQLAKMISGISDYSVEMEEIHHTQKLDAPSGTAITLAEGIIQNSNYEAWVLGDASENQIPIKHKRIGKVPGTHSITYHSEVDSITIQHMAHNRTGFALGALLASEWLDGKTGVYSMQDVLNLH